MASYEIVVTDVTCYGTLYCVAGWDCQRNCMIRPEPPGANARAEASRFWDGQLAGEGRTFSVGNIVRFDASAARADFAFPHATEDRVIDQVRSIQLIDQVDRATTVEMVAAGNSRSLDEAFDGGLVRSPWGKAYVPIGHRGRSLGAINTVWENIEVFEDKYKPQKPKLRARLVVDGRTYDLSVTDDRARTRWKNGGLSALQSDNRRSKCVHVRTGLSRPFPAMPDQCYAQINGLFFL